MTGSLCWITGYTLPKMSCGSTCTRDGCKTTKPHFTRSIPCTRCLRLGSGVHAEVHLQASVGKVSKSQLRHLLGSFSDGIGLIEGLAPREFSELASSEALQEGRGLWDCGALGCLLLRHLRLGRCQSRWAKRWGRQRALLEIAEPRGPGSAQKGCAARASKECRDPASRSDVLSSSATDGVRLLFSGTSVTPPGSSRNESATWA